MKYLTILILLAISSVVSAQAVFTVKQPLHKFPKATDGDQLQHFYVFTNTGNVPLVITDYSVACVCTKVFFPLKPILPGQTDSIRVTFDTKTKLGYHLRKVSLQSNAANSPLELSFKVFVRKKD